VHVVTAAARAARFVVACDRAAAEDGFGTRDRFEFVVLEGFGAFGGFGGFGVRRSR
jgi:hypothetical protein